MNFLPSPDEHKHTVWSAIDFVRELKSQNMIFAE
jgi:hypothetical protein